MGVADYQRNLGKFKLRERDSKKKPHAPSQAASSGSQNTDSSGSSATTACLVALTKLMEEKTERASKQLLAIEDKPPEVPPKAAPDAKAEPPEVAHPTEPADAPSPFARMVEKFGAGKASLLDDGDGPLPKKRPSSSPSANEEPAAAATETMNNPKKRPAAATDSMTGSKKRPAGMLRPYQDKPTPAFEVGCLKCRGSQWVEQGSQPQRNAIHYLRLRYQRCSNEKH
jgi:hypothetical protein